MRDRAPHHGGANSLESAAKFKSHSPLKPDMTGQDSIEGELFYHFFNSGQMILSEATEAAEKVDVTAFLAELNLGE
jgi:hypothetical protein